MQVKTSIPITLHIPWVIPPPAPKTIEQLPDLTRMPDRRHSTSTALTWCFLQKSKAQRPNSKTEAAHTPVKMALSKEFHNS